MVVNDWAQCPNCSFPALFSAFAAYLVTDKGTRRCFLRVPAPVHLARLFAAFVRVRTQCVPCVMLRSTARS